MTCLFLFGIHLSRPMSLSSSEENENNTNSDSDDYDNDIGNCNWELIMIATVFILAKDYYSYKT